MTKFNDKIKNILAFKRLLTENKVMQLSYSPSFGINQEFVEVTEYDKFAVRESDDTVGDFYYYAGPETERKFCKYMLTLDKVFSSGELQQLSQLLGYMSSDGLDYIPGPIMPNGGPGGPNCRHYWIKFRGKIVLTTAPTERQIKTLVSKSVFE